MSIGEERGRLRFGSGGLDTVVDPRPGKDKELESREVFGHATADSVAVLTFYPRHLLLKLGGR